MTVRSHFHRDTRLFLVLALLIALAAGDREAALALARDGAGVSARLADGRSVPQVAPDRRRRP